MQKRVLDKQVPLLMKQLGISFPSSPANDTADAPPEEGLSNPGGPMDDQVSLPLGRYGGLSRCQWHASRAGADADSRNAYNAAINVTRTPRTTAGHICTGGKRRRGPVASQTPPSSPETIPDSEDDESVQSGDTDQPPDDYTNIKSQYDVGYSDKLLSCTGAVVAVVARSRAQLWQGSHPDSPIPFCAELEDFPCSV